MGAHHAFHLNDSCHIIFLLDFCGSRHRLRHVFCFFLHAEVPQPQGIGHHKDGAAAHSRRTEHGTQSDAKGRQHACRNGNAQAVIEQGPEQILSNIPDGSLTERHRIGNGLQTAADQHHISRLHGDVGTGIDGHAHIGRHQRGGIVDTVTHHDHLVAFLLELLHRTGLVTGKHIGDHMGDARLSGDGLGYLSIIACQHDHVKLHFLHGRNRRHRIRFQYVSGSNSAQIGTGFIGKIQGRFALGGEFLVSRNGNAMLRHQLGVAAEVADTIHHTADTPAGNGLKICHRRQSHTFRLGQNSLGKGMLGTLFDGGGNGQQTGCIVPRCQNIRHSRLAGGQRTGLVQHHRIHVVEIFQRFCVLEQHTHTRAAACAHHDGHRGSQSQRTGTGDHQHGNGCGQGEFQILTHNHPEDKRCRRDTHDHRHKDTGDLVRHPGDGGLGTAGLLYHVDNLRQGGVLTNLLGPEFQIAFRIDGSCRYGIAWDLFHRDAFTGEGTLIHRAAALNHRAIHRDPAAGADDDGVTHLHILHGNLRFYTITANTCRLGAEVHQGPNGIAGLAFGPGLQEFAQGDEGQDHGSRFKIQIGTVMLHRLPVSRTHGIRHHKERRHAIDQRRTGTHRNEGIHVGSLMPQGFQATGKIHPVQIHRRQGQEKLQQRGYHGIFQTVVPMRFRQAHHVTHGKIHQNHQENGRTDDPLLHLLQGIFLSGRSLFFLLFLTRQAGAITAVRNRLDDGLGHRFAFHISHHGARQQIHFRVPNAGNRFRHLFHSGGTGRAGHASDVEFQLHVLPPSQ